MDYVALYARSRPNKLAIQDLTFARKWTYAELDREVACCVSVLISKQVEKGNRVVCLSKNRAEMLLLHFACARLGAIFVPLNWRLSASEIHALIEDSDPIVCYGDELAKEMGVDMLNIDELFSETKSLGPSSNSSTDLDLPSLMLYTSGTTGRPKGVLLSERNLTETAINFGVLGEVDSNSGSYCESPMFHIIGAITSVRPALMKGAHIVISDGFEPARTLSRIADPELKLTHYFCVPQMALALRAVEGFNPDSLRNLKALFTGGAPHPEVQIRDWLNDGIPIVDGYGSSEAGTVFGMPLDIEVIDAKAGSIGLPTPRIEARIVDSSGDVLSVGQAGELQLRGHNLTSGYWQREEDTTKAFTDDGWFCTGDVCSIDEDGFYRIVDRKKDMFISGGENIYPAELEALLVKYPGMKEQAVVGIADEKWGEVGCIFYVGDKEIELEEVVAFLSENLARYKLPKRICKVDSLPRNAAGKVLKPKLKELV
jgi:fatty-acyl-CoA synthase